MPADARPSAHPDPYRDIDAQADIDQFIASLEARGRTPSQRRLRRSFLRFIPIRSGQRVLEVGCGTGVVLRDIAKLVGSRGHALGVDQSRALIAAARRLIARDPRHARLAVRCAIGEQLPFRRPQFDVTLAVTVILHVQDPLRIVKEMARVTRRGGHVAVQDQDFGTVAVAHPDRALTDQIMGGVAARMYEEPYSGRRLPGLLRSVGLERVRLLTDVYQDTTLTPYTKTFLERRAERAVTWGIVEAAAAQRWLDGFTALVAAGGFVMTMNYYGAVGQKPAASD